MTALAAGLFYWRWTFTPQNAIRSHMTSQYRGRVMFSYACATRSDNVIDWAFPDRLRRPASLAVSGRPDLTTVATWLSSSASHVSSVPVPPEGRS